MHFLPFLPLLPLLLLSITLSPSEARIVGAYVLPHGGIALNPSRFESHSKWAKQWAWSLHRAAVDVGEHIRQLQADLIVVSTPHGVADLNKFMLYLNAKGNGSAATDNCECPPCCYDVEVPMDSAISEALIGNLTAKGCNVSGLSFFGPVGNVENANILKWGEVIPLLFIKDMGKAKVVVLSQPSRRYEHAVNMIPELLDLGHKLYDFLEELPLRVAVVISADLAHTHEASGPYGFSPDAEPFDMNIGNWASTLHPTYLLEKAARYAKGAMSCGYTGLVMSHGLMEQGKLSSWIAVMHANYHPSYYGMMVASFSRKTNSLDSSCPNCVPKNNLF